jgi:hypothetical protein
MRILICGGYWEGDSILILSHGLWLMGHQVAHVGTTRFMHDFNIERAHREVEAVKPETFDLVIFWNSKWDVHPDFVASVAKKARVLYWTVDPIPISTIHGQWHNIIMQCPVALFPSVDECELYSKRGIKCFINHTPYDLWTGSPTGKDFACDIGFMAGTCYKREDWPEQIGTRAEIVREALKVTQSLKVYGEWDTPRGWHNQGEVADIKYWGGWTNPDEQIESAKGAKISLSSHARPTQRQCLRDVDTTITGSGGFLLTDYVKEIEQVFKPGVECETFKDLQELKDKIDYYLRHDEERKRIALAGKERTMMQYSNIVMVKLLEDIVSGKR